MSRKLFLLPASFFVMLAAFSQEQKVREIDWQDFASSVSDANIAKPVKTGEFAIFRINNINKFLYKVEIKGKAFVLETPIPSELETLFRLKPSELAKTATNKKSEEGVAKISDAVSSNNNLIEALNKNKAAKPPELLAFEAAVKDLVQKIEEFRSKSKDVSIGVFDLKSGRNKLISIAQMDAEFTAISTQVNQLTIPTDQVKSDYVEMKDLYAQVLNIYDDAKQKGVEAGIGDEEAIRLEDIAKKVDQGQKLIEEEALLSLITDIEFLSTELVNKNNFKITAPPVQMEGDIVVYKVTVTPIITRSLGAHKNPTDFEFSIPAQGGVKVDFSVGPVVCFGKNSRDEKYFLKETLNPDSVTLETRPNNNEISPGVAAMMHFYRRSGKSWGNWGGLFGVGAGFQSIDDVNLSLYAGVSGVFGKTQKVMIGAGFGFLRVDRLKDSQFTAGGKYAIKKIELGNVTEKVFRSSLFLTISYNLTTRKEIN